MHISAIVYFFIFVYVGVTHAMISWDDFAQDVPALSSNKSWVDDFDKRIVKKKFDSLEVPKIVVQEVFPIMMGNSMEWGLTERIDHMDGQPEIQTHSAAQEENKRKESVFLSHFDTLRHTVRLSELARAGFAYEAEERFQFSNTLLVLLAYRQDFVDMEKEKAFQDRGRFSGIARGKVKKEIDIVIDALTPVLGADTITKMTEFAKEQSNKSWGEIKNAREDGLRKFPVLMVSPRNIKNHPEIFQYVLRYVYRDLTLLQQHEEAGDYKGFHLRLAFGFRVAGMMIDPNGIDYINDFKAAVLDVLKNRGFLFGRDQEDIANDFGVRVDSLGSVDTISFTKMAELIADFCYDNSLCEFKTAPAGHALVVESMAWLVETYRAENSKDAADYLLKVLNTLLTRLAPHVDYPICYSLTGLFPSHVKTIEATPIVSSSSIQAVPQQTVSAPEIPVIRFRAGQSDGLYSIIRSFKGNRDEFMRCARSILSEYTINNILNDYRTAQEQSYQMAILMTSGAKRLAKLAEEGESYFTLKW